MGIEFWWSWRGRSIQTSVPVPHTLTPSSFELRSSNALEAPLRQHACDTFLQHHRCSLPALTPILQRSDGTDFNVESDYTGHITWRMMISRDLEVGMSDQPRTTTFVTTMARKTVDTPMLRDLIIRAEDAEA